MSLPTQDTTLGTTNLYLNPTMDEEWDLVFDENGQLVTISGTEYIGQKVKQLLSTAQAEVDTDITYGVPYFDQIIGVKNPNLITIGNLFAETILSNQTLIDLGVVECSVGELKISPDRVLTVDELVVTTSSATITISNLEV